jgi:hypothetical protein
MRRRCFETRLAARQTPKSAEVDADRRRYLSAASEIDVPVFGSGWERCGVLSVNRGCRMRLRESLEASCRASAVVLKQRFQGSRQAAGRGIVKKKKLRNTGQAVDYGLQMLPS